MTTKKRKEYVGEIPFDENGNQLHYASYGCIDIQNYVFSDTLIYKRHARGRSSVYFIFERSNGKTVSVFLTDLDSIIDKISNGKITDTFTFCKRGSNFGCKLIG